MAIGWVLGGLPLAYVLGTFPSAVLVARSRGIDITKVGSGNPGASNVARTMGAAWGIAVFALDGLKGALPATAGLIAGSRPAAYAWIAAAVVGHMFPVTRHFAGGKGVATVGGAMLVIHPIVSAILLATWVVVRKVTGTASVASLVVTIALPVGVAVEGARAWEVLAVIGLCLLVLIRHAGNIGRLVRGRELRAGRARRGEVATKGAAGPAR